MSARSGELEFEFEDELEAELEAEAEEFAGAISGGTLVGRRAIGFHADGSGRYGRDRAHGLYLPERQVARRPARAATLASLRSFTQSYVRAMIRRSQRIDCADLAIEVWIRFGERYGVPVEFRVWDARGRRWLTATRTGVRAGRRLVRRFSSVAAFVRWVQVNLGAQGLVRNTFAVPGGHRRAVAGDVFLWRYRNNRTGAFAPVGHTQILDRVIRSSGGPLADIIELFQGDLPPKVPQHRRMPASHFYRNRLGVIIRNEPHTGIPVGPGPRRFNAFRSLQ